MKILIVGGTRFFGIGMTRSLIAKGHDITVATRQSGGFFGDSVKYAFFDRMDGESVKRAVGGECFDIIIDKVAYCSDDVRSLLENVRCGRYIQMSTCSVYDEDKDGIIENVFIASKYPILWMNRNENYAEGKRQAERAALEFVDESNCVFVRYPVVLGKNDYTERLKWYVRHVSNGIPMYVDDLDYGVEYIQEQEAGCFIAHLVNQDFSGPVNGCSTGQISARSIIEYIEKKTGKKAILNRNGEPAPFNGTVANTSYDTQKALATGFRFSKIEDWIFDLLDYYIERQTREET